jgi:GT2 family glycosyltransferase/glycosyltransferase involved in cell wall biosynthesis
VVNYKLDVLPRYLGRAPPEHDLRRAEAMARSAWKDGEAYAAGADWPNALRWLGRAHRIAPGDQNILFSLAFAYLRAGDAASAVTLFCKLAESHRTRECYCGWIAALQALGRREAAAQALDLALGETAADAALISLAERQEQPWCGMTDDGVLLYAAAGEQPSLCLDGETMPFRPAGDGRFRLPAKLFRGHRLHVLPHDGQPPLGGRISLDRMFRLDGFAERAGNVVTGFAWYPGAPDKAPCLKLFGPGGEKLGGTRLSQIMPEVQGATPLARPRAFRITAPRDITVHVLDSYGRALLGSPVAPDAVPPPSGGRRRRPARENKAVDVIIPVYRGQDMTLACLESVLDCLEPDMRVIVVNDASPEPGLVSALRRLADAGRILLIPASADGTNKGFPAAVNAGLRAAGGRHAVLLNSDTLVAPGWLGRLRDAVLSAPDIGTATPLSNEASILSYPDEAGKNPAPDLAETRRLDGLAQQANRGRLVEIPTANGFCMFIRAACLHEAGLFEETLFSQGYAEENDFCERARARGWRHVAVPEIFVAHVGGQSFGAGRLHLLQRNLRLLERRHPGYASRVADWIAADPLFPARRRLDQARFADDGVRQVAALGTAARSVVLVTHGGGGGTARFVTSRAREIAAAGRRPIILREADGFCEVSGLDQAYPNLRFALPAERAALTALLKSAGAHEAELHHLLGHDHDILGVLGALGLPYVLYVHDYAWFCHRLSFVTGEGRFCGEADTTQCVDCVASWGSELHEDIAPAALRERSRADFRAAREVIAPSEDVARRVARHVPGIVPVIRAWEEPLAGFRPNPVPQRGFRRVAVIGAIGQDKGFGVLLDCARDAAARRLPLEFIVVGYTMDDEQLLATGKAFITGEFRSGEAETLIRAQSADLAFIPSIWPETWCYALSDAWEAGLPAAVFDIGTPALRVRAACLGWVLPLGLPAPRVNDALASLAMRNILPALSRATR